MFDLKRNFEKKYLKKRIKFRVGDTIKVHLKIKEGKKERVQPFVGIVIAKKSGGLSETFSLYRNAYGSSMERVFPLHSPNIKKIEIIKRGKVRKAKLYYLRGTTGKKARVTTKIGSFDTKEEKDSTKKVIEKEQVSDQNQKEELKKQEKILEEHESRIEKKEE